MAVAENADLRITTTALRKGLRPCGSFLHLSQTVSILNVSGQTVYKTSKIFALAGEYNLPLDSTRLSAGCYIVSVKLPGNQQTLSGKVIVSR
jgi:hypothetical protein